MRHIRTVAGLIALSGALPCFSTALAAGGREAVYRCKDSNGATHVSDSKPPACEGFDTEVLSSSGTVMRVIEGDKTRVAREQRELVEANAKAEQDKRLQRDRMLIETYASVEDIERLRDQRLELVDSQNRVTQQNVRNLRERQTRLEAQIARFKPYNDAPNAPPLPDHLAEEMVNTVNGMRVYEETLAKTRQEQSDIRASFGGDIKRFRELRGLK